MSDNLIKLTEIKNGVDLEKISVKEYLGFSIKKVMINNILEFCKVTQDNLIKIDYALLEMVKTISIITQYTNIEIPDNIVFAYDYLRENKIDEYVLERINVNETIFINNILNSEIKQIIEEENSMQNILSKALNSFIEKIPDEKAISKIIKDIPKNINKIKPETLALLKNMGINNK